MKSSLERQLALIEKRKAEGLKRFCFWCAPADVEVLRGRYPGERGGVDWQAVIKAALTPAPQPEAAPTDYTLEVERLQRKIRQLEKDHARGVANYRQMIDDLDAKLAQAEAENKQLKEKK